jgi:hypothetical protein
MNQNVLLIKCEKRHLSVMSLSAQGFLKCLKRVSENIYIECHKKRRHRSINNMKRTYICYRITLGYTCKFHFRFFFYDLDVHNENFI